MTEITIDTKLNHENVELQVREMETGSLIDIYDMFERNPTVFTLVANELMYRREHETKLEHEGQIEEINQRFR